MRNVNIPLYFGHPAGSQDPQFSFTLQDGFELLTKSALEGLRDAGDYGALTIWILDTPGEARFAAEGVREPMGDEVSVISARVSGGIGAMLIHYPEGDGDVGFFDKRRPNRIADEESVNLSWEMEAEPFRTHERQPASNKRTAEAIAAMAKEAIGDDADAVQDLQLELETIPGAWVAFATETLQGVYATFDNDLPEEISEDLAAQIHQEIRTAANKIILPEVGSSIDDEIWNRLNDAGLFDDDPEP